MFFFFLLQPFLSLLERAPKFATIAFLILLEGAAQNAFTGFGFCWNPLQKLLPPAFWLWACRRLPLMLQPVWCGRHSWCDELQLRVCSIFCYNHHRRLLQPTTKFAATKIARRLQPARGLPPWWRQARGSRRARGGRGRARSGRGLERQPCFLCYFSHGKDTWRRKDALGA